MDKRVALAAGVILGRFPVDYEKRLEAAETFLVYFMLGEIPYDGTQFFSACNLIRDDEIGLSEIIG